MTFNYSHLISSIHTHVCTCLSVYTEYICSLVSNAQREGPHDAKDIAGASNSPIYKSVCQFNLMVYNDKFNHSVSILHTNMCPMCSSG